MITDESASWFRDSFQRLVENVEVAVRGKSTTVRLALTCLLSEGHLLLEDVPGTGKTALAKSIANTVQGSVSRIQFTPDLLPSDVTGVTIFNQEDRRFEFHPGPVMSNIVLADEINRASPKTQAALLEVMEEGQVTVDGVQRPVGPPFMVIATQNPIEHAGTYRLPEAQLDRFLIRTSLGPPDHDTAVELLGEAATRDRSLAVHPLITADAVKEMAELAGTVHVERPVLSYVVRIVEEIRCSGSVRLGVSMRGALWLVRAAKTWAAADGRTYVVPNDIKALASPVLEHRVLLTPEAEFSGTTVASVVRSVLDDLKPPTERAA